MVALACLVAFLSCMAIRVYCKFKLLYEYKIDDYLATPRARRMWYSAMLLAPVGMIPLIIATTITHLWWVTTAACIFSALVVYQTVWAMWMRLSGRYRAFYGLK